MLSGWSLSAQSLESIVHITRYIFCSRNVSSIGREFRWFGIVGSCTRRAKQRNLEVPSEGLVEYCLRILKFF